MTTINKLCEPRKKKWFKPNTHMPLPIFKNETTEEIIFIGNFDGYSVLITNPPQMFKIYLNGFFGKGNLSRSYPSFNKEDNVNVIRQRQLDWRNKWVATHDDSSNRTNKPSAVIVVPDSDSETEDYFKNCLPKFEINKLDIKEHLNLGLEEAFFLGDALGVLQVESEGKILSSGEAWDLFSNVDPFFVQNYIAYYYFRSRNWVVKSGLKYGGDYLLYKEGPSFYHASYVVIIDVVDEQSLRRKLNSSRRSMQLQNVVGLQRLCETAGKDMLIFEIIWPKDLEKVTFGNINRIAVKEILLKRWLATSETSDSDNFVISSLQS